MSGVETGALLFGTPAYTLGAGMTGPVAAATSGLIGTGGAFSLASGLTLGLGALDVLGSLSAGYNESAAAKANARRVEAEAAYNAEQKRRQTRSLLSSQRAAYGASGAVATEGTPVEVLSSTAAEGELDALSILYGGQSEADILRRKARSSESSGIFGAGTSLLKTGLSLAKR
jgi:hypothetical protein